MFNKTLYIEHLKRFWAVSAIAVVCYLAFVYAPVATTNNAWNGNWRLSDLVSMASLPMLVIMVLTPLAAAFCTFGSFFNKQAATLFYSLPLTKTRLFFTNALAGLTLALVPVVIFCVVLLFPINFEQEGAVYWAQPRVAFDSHSDSWGDRFVHTPQSHLPSALLPDGIDYDAPINTPRIISGLFLRMALVTVFYFALAWLAFSLAGHGVIGILITGLAAFLPVILLGLAEMIAQMYIFGYTNAGLSGDGFAQFLAYHNPITWGNMLRWGDFTRMQAIILPFITNTVLAAAMFAGAFFVSRIRRPERVGNSVMFSPVKNVLIFLVALGFMLFAGIWAYVLWDETLFMMYVGFAGGFVFGYIVAQMIAEKSFRIGGKFKFLPHFFGTAAGLYLLMALVTQFGLGFYVNRVPAEGEIAGVFFGPRWTVMNLAPESRHLIFFDDAESISQTREAHRLIIDNRSELRVAPQFNRGSRSGELPDGRFVNTQEMITFHYMLTDGRIVTREYTLPRDFIMETGIYEFLDSPAVVLSTHHILKMPEVLNSVWLNFGIPTDDENFAPEFDDDALWWWRGINVDVFEDWQIEIVLEYVARGLVQNAVNDREGFFWWSSDEWGLAPDEWATVSINFSIDHDNAPSGMWSWRHPHFRGEYVWRLYELVHEWGLVWPEEYAEYAGDSVVIRRR